MVATVCAHVPIMASDLGDVATVTPIHWGKKRIRSLLGERLWRASLTVSKICFSFGTGRFVICYSTCRIKGKTLTKADTRSIRRFCSAEGFATPWITDGFLELLSLEG